MRTRLAAAAWMLVAVGGFSGAARGEDCPPDRIIKVDVIEVAEGRTTEGDGAHAVDHQGYRYLFISEEHAAAFRADPERYEVGMDGFCANMGPLAGRGSTAITATHNGRLYLCASEFCRGAFLADPESHIDKDDPPASGTERNPGRGRQWVAEAIRVHFGEAGIGSVRTLEQRFEEVQEQGGEASRHVDRIVLGAEGEVRSETSWNDSTWAHVAAGGDAWMEAPDAAPEAMDEEGRRELERRVRDVHWLSVLRAVADPNTKVMHIGAADLLGREDRIERVVVSFDGVSCVLGIDSEERTIRTIEYTARGGDSRFAKRTRVFTAFERVGGVLVPTAWETYANGEKVAERSGVAVRVNPEDGAAAFVRPGG